MKDWKIQPLGEQLCIVISPRHGFGTDACLLVHFTGLSLATDSYQFEVDEEVGDIGEQTCYLVHAYLVEDGTGIRHLEATLYVAVDGSQVYTYDLNNDAFLPLWDTEEEESQEASETTSE